MSRDARLLCGAPSREPGHQLDRLHAPGSHVNGRRGCCIGKLVTPRAAAARGFIRRLPRMARRARVVRDRGRRLRGGKMVRSSRSTVRRARPSCPLIREARLRWREGHSDAMRAIR